MTSATVTSIRAERDVEGFLLDPTQWTEAAAKQIARENGIEELTDRHWLVINAIRDAYLRRHAARSIRVLTKVSGVSIDELYRLFPRNPGNLAGKIAGLPKWRGL